MNVLICNVGSTSLKYQLFRMPEELVAASGGAERVGTDAGRFYAKTQENGALVDEAAVFPSHREAIERMLLQLQQTVLPDLRALDAAFRKYGPSATVLAMPHGGSTLPYLQDAGPDHSRT